jgi:hypothetical protein
MIATLFVVLTFSLLYWFPIRRWMNRWGATSSDVACQMAGDNLLVDPTYSGTMAVLVNAKPEHIWPWLVQIGYRRGGLYSYDWLDRLFGYLDRPSATRILPEFQHLAVGDHIPLGRGPSWPVAVLEPNRTLLLIGCGSLACTQLTRREHDSSRAAASVHRRCGPSCSRMPSSLRDFS